MDNPTLKDMVFAAFLEIRDTKAEQEAAQLAVRAARQALDDAEARLSTARAASETASVKLYRLYDAAGVN